MVFPINPSVKQFRNYPTGYPVDANVTFKPNGDLIPIYFRIERNSIREVYKIRVIKSIRDYGNIKSFECSYEAYGHLMTVILRFDIENRLWVLGE